MKLVIHTYDSHKPTNGVNSVKEKFLIHQGKYYQPQKCYQVLDMRINLAILSTHFHCYIYRHKCGYSAIYILPNGREKNQKKFKRIESSLRPFFISPFFFFSIWNWRIVDWRFSCSFDVFFCSNNFIHNGNKLCACIAGELMNIRVKAERKVQTIRRKWTYTHWNSIIGKISRKGAYFECICLF